MRISTTQINLRALNALLKQQADVSRTQFQLASGKRITLPSDDPNGSSRILNINESLSITEQYQTNISLVTSRQRLEENVLDSAVDLLQRVKELSIQAANSTHGSQGRNDISLEIRQRFDELYNIANTRDANGEFIFAGFQGFTQPFTLNSSGSVDYNGDQGQRFLQISETRTIADRDPGSDVFQAVTNGNGTFSVKDNANNTGGGIIHTGSVIDPSLYDGDSYTLLFGNDSDATTANVGAFGFTDVIGTNDVLTYTLQINGTTVYSVTDAGTPVTTLQGLADEINNDSGTTGVSAYVNSGKLFFTNTSPTSTDIQITETFSGFTASDGDSVTSYFGNTLDENNTSATITLSNSGAQNYIVMDSDNNIETTGTYSPEQQISFNGITTSVKGTPNIGDNYTITPSAYQDMFQTLDALADAMEPGGATTETNANNTINRMLLELDNTINHIVRIRSGIGARLNSAESQLLINEDFKITLEQSRSTIEDLDYASAITRFEQQLTGMQAAQQSFARIQGLSLFNYL